MEFDGALARHAGETKHTERLKNITIYHYRKTNCYI
jgi:hypothetical protein